jgi:hypothetical protein
MFSLPTACHTLVPAILIILFNVCNALWPVPRVCNALWPEVVPGYLDEYLAETGYSGQQTNEPEKGRRDNLWEPIPGDHGARGPFDKEAKHSSPLFVAKKHKWLTAAGIGALVFGVGFLINKLGENDYVHFS